MLYAWLVGLVLLDAFWWTLTLFSLPGNWLMVLSTCLFAWWRWDQRPFSGATLITIVALALLGELVEFLAGMIGARRSGASWRGALTAIFGAIFGAIVGTFAIPVPFLGSLIGASAGAGLVVWASEISRGQPASPSLRRGVSAGIGQFLGTGSKLVIGLAIWLVIAVAAFWP